MNFLTNNKEGRILGLIGLATRVGRISLGEEKVYKDIKNNNSHLIILSSDASENTSKKALDKCKFYSKKLIVFSDRFSLGRYTGKEFSVLISVNDKNFSERILQLYCEMNIN